MARRVSSWSFSLCILMATLRSCAIFHNRRFGCGSTLRFGVTRKQNTWGRAAILDDRPLFQRPLAVNKQKIGRSTHKALLICRFYFCLRKWLVVKEWTARCLKFAAALLHVVQFPSDDVGHVLLGKLSSSKAPHAAIRHRFHEVYVILHAMVTTVAAEKLQFAL